MHGSFSWLALSLLLLPQLGHAFLFPEHRDIAVRAIEELIPAQREAFDTLWSEAEADTGIRRSAQRTGYLCVVSLASNGRSCTHCA